MGVEIHFFFNSVLRPFQDYFSSYETGQSVSALSGSVAASVLSHLVRNSDDRFSHDVT